MPPILFYFFIASELNPLKVDQIVLPLHTPPVVHHFLSLRHYPQCVFGWLLCGI